MVWVVELLPDVGAVPVPFWISQSRPATPGIRTVSAVTAFGRCALSIVISLAVELRLMLLPAFNDLKRRSAPTLEPYTPSPAPRLLAVLSTPVPVALMVISVPVWVTVTLVPALMERKRRSAPDLEAYTCPAPAPRLLAVLSTPVPVALMVISVPVWVTVTLVPALMERSWSVLPALVENTWPSPAPRLPAVTA